MQVMLIKRVVDASEKVLSRLPFSVEARYYDRYYDNTLKVVRGFGFTAGYVTTPDGNTTSFLRSAHDIGQARRIGYAEYDATYRKWIHEASSHDLLRTRDQMKADRIPDRKLIQAIQDELDLRAGYGLQFANAVAYQ